MNDSSENERTPFNFNPNESDFAVSSALTTGDLILSQSTGVLENMAQQAGKFHNTAATLLALSSASEATGGHVRFLSEYHFCPVLQGSSGQIVPLYEFIQAIDAVIDYDHLKNEFPFFSYAQINGAMLFLRKIAQFNILDIDIDEQGDEDLDPALLAALEKAVADQEISRVLDFHE